MYNVCNIGDCIISNFLRIYQILEYIWMQLLVFWKLYTKFYLQLLFEIAHIENINYP